LAVLAFLVTVELLPLRLQAALLTSKAVGDMEEIRGGRVLEEDDDPPPG
jgi:hypothetical protein